MFYITYSFSLKKQCFLSLMGATFVFHVLLFQCKKAYKFCQKKASYTIKEINNKQPFSTSTISTPCQRWYVLIINTV